MKTDIKQKYLTPIAQARKVEMEGLLCFSISTAPNADEIHNINADTESEEPSYLEF